ncbi:hypothetical protein PMAYCL1PPCAC_12623, partial [Pristionchus mayeri]
PLRSLCLLSFFSLVLSVDSSCGEESVAGKVSISLGKGGKHSEEEEVSSLQYTTVSGNEVIVRPEIFCPSFNVSTCSNNGPCAKGGECVYLDENLPTHRVACYCYSGYRGRYCNESFRTKLIISFFFWGVFVIEVVLIGIALCRSGDESSYPSSPTARALVFILQERRLD